MQPSSLHPRTNLSKGDRQMLQRSNFKIRLLVGCDGLELDTSRFRGGERSPTCKLCNSADEDAMHFLPAPREMLLSGAPPTLSAYTSSPNLLINYLLGTSWLDDLPTRSELHTRAKKSPCRPNNCVIHYCIITTWPIRILQRILSYQRRQERQRRRRHY